MLILLWLIRYPILLAILIVVLCLSLKIDSCPIMGLWSLISSMSIWSWIIFIHFPSLIIWMCFPQWCMVLLLFSSCELNEFTKIKCIFNVLWKIWIYMEHGTWKYFEFGGMIDVYLTWCVTSFLPTSAFLLVNLSLSIDSCHWCSSNMKALVLAFTTMVWLPKFLATIINLIISWDPSKKSFISIQFLWYLHFNSI